MSCGGGWWVALVATSAAVGAAVMRLLARPSGVRRHEGGVDMSAAVRERVRAHAERVAQLEERVRAISELSTGTEDDIRRRARELDAEAERELEKIRILHDSIRGRR